MKPRAPNSKPAIEKPVAPQPERRPAEWEIRLEAFGRKPLAYALVSLLLLIPCFWQSRIHAGDLSSHIYNAWLAQQIGAGKLPGFTVAPQTTNVLFDLVLAALLPAVGASAAQRIAVSAAVLILAWGAFYFVRRLSGTRPWAVMPVIAIVAYGWTFHMGFFNMYISLGLCLWALGIGWSGKARDLAIGALLLGIAYVAHGLPVAWAVAVAGYGFVARRAGPRVVLQLLAISIAAIVLLRIVLVGATETRWLPSQALSATGGYQALLYGPEYQAIAVGIIVLWAVLLYARIREEGIRTLLHNVPFQFAVLTAAGIALLPTGIAIPGYKHLLVFISERMSLAVAICYCAAVSGGRIPGFARYLSVGLMLGFFGILAHDDSVLNRYEDRMRQATSTLAGQRVVTGFIGIDFNVDPFVHMVDRACLGVCYSYANYEPTTEQFRVRVSGPNRFVMDKYTESWDMQQGHYVVKPSDAPLYRLDADAAGAISAHELPVGEPNGVTVVNTLR